MLAAVILVSTALAVTRRNLMHAIVYLVLSFFGTALLFYLLGAPFLAVLEVIIYAGAIMVLFLFIVMMLEVRASEEPIGAYLLRWLPAAVLGALSLAAACRVDHVQVRQQPAAAAGHGVAPGIRPVSVPEVLVFGGDRLLSALCGPGGGLLSGEAGRVGALRTRANTRFAPTITGRRPVPLDKIMNTIVPYSHVLILAGAVFFLGAACAVARRNLVMILIGVEVMLNAAGVALVAASLRWQQLDGQAFVIFIMCVAAAEVAVGLALIVYSQRRTGTLDADRYNLMKG